MRNEERTIVVENTRLWTNSRWTWQMDSANNVTIWRKGHDRKDNWEATLGSLIIHRDNQTSSWTINQLNTFQCHPYRLRRRRISSRRDKRDPRGYHFPSNSRINHEATNVTIFLSYNRSMMRTTFISNVSRHRVHRSILLKAPKSEARQQVYFLTLMLVLMDAWSNFSCFYCWRDRRKLKGWQSVLLGVTHLPVRDNARRRANYMYTSTLLVAGEKRSCSRRIKGK